MAARKLMMCSGPSNSCPDPGQQTLRYPGLLLLLLKTTLICDFLGEKQADLVCITKTWLTPEEGFFLLEMCPAGFRIRHQLRPQGRGGNVAVVIQESCLAFGSYASQNSRCDTVPEVGPMESVGSVTAAITPDITHGS